MFYAFILLFNSEIILSASGAEIPFDIHTVFGVQQERIFTRTSDHRIAIFNTDGDFLEAYSPTENTPGKVNRINNALLIPNTDIVWVSDIQNRTVRIYEDGQLKQTIQDVFVRCMLYDNGQVLLCPPRPDHPFVWVQLSGEKSASFNINIPWDQERYNHKAWQDFTTLLLPDNRLLLTFTWANKIAIAPRSSGTAEVIEMTYPENAHNGNPVGQSQTGALPKGDGAFWILACNFRDNPCSDILLFDIKRREVVRTQKLEEALARFGRLSNGMIFTIDMDDKQARIYREMPFK